MRNVIALMFLCVAACDPEDEDPDQVGRTCQDTGIACGGDTLQACSNASATQTFYITPDGERFDCNGQFDCGDAAERAINYCENQ